MRCRTAIFFATLLAVLGGCDPDPGTTRIDARIASPDGRIEAVSAEDLGGGATVASTASVYLVSPGKFPRPSDRVFAKQGACHVRIRWIDARTLAVSFAARDGAYQTKRSAFSAAIDVRVAWRGRDEKAGC